MARIDHQTLVAENKRYTLGSWSAQQQWKPPSIIRGEGVYFWDADERRYLDWSSQVFNANLGHSHPHMVRGIQEQAGRLACAHPGFATEPRAELGRLLTELLPGGRSKAFFTLGGSDAIENALKIARLYTGRQKILARYRAYHGATFGAMSAGGDPRRLANEPGVPWVVHIHDPYRYRSPLYNGRTQDEGDQALVELIEQTVLLEGPERIAALLLEGYSGASGIIQGGEAFWQGVARLCRAYGILLVVDEVLSGFGRTGRWFGFQHYPQVEPDMIVLGKGLTAGYAPLGAVLVRESIAEHFEQNVLWAGLTYMAHPICLAAARSAIEVYRDEGLIERAHELGLQLQAGLAELARQHICVGEVRGAGLHHVLELVADPETRRPLSDFNAPLSEPMRQIAGRLRESGLSTIVRWNWIFCSPPLIITEAQIAEALELLDAGLEIGDRAIAASGSPHPGGGL